MVARFIFCCTFLWLISDGLHAETKIVNRIVTIDVKNITLKKVLQIIEQKAYFKFSYNSEIIDENRAVNLKLENQTVSACLRHLFNGTIRYKEVGNHLILLKNNEVVEQKTKIKESYFFTGKITDLSSGLPLSGVSIYDVEKRQASISDEYGNYQLTLSTNESMRGFYFSKKGYYDTLIVVKAENSLVNDIALQPVEEPIQKLPGATIQPIQQPIEDRPISKLIISEERATHAENLVVIEETRFAQISLLPSIGIGSNLSTNGLIINHLSLNVLAGYSNGVKGVEIGGIMNANKNNVIGVQIAGVGNLVGGSVKGFQVGGISNIVMQSVSGVQIGGVNNLVKGNFLGVQIGGVSNIITGGFNGLQLAGINNFSNKNSYGFQVSGINNIVADTLYGGQISGIGNWAKKGINTCQISGIFNIAHINKGVQITGIYNHVKINNGTQIGLFNYSHSGTGISFGLFSYVKEGYRSTELFNNDIFHVNLAFKTGVKRFYNYYTIGTNLFDKTMYGVGIGFGDKSQISKRLSISSELYAQLIQFDNFATFQNNNLYRLTIGPDIRLSKWITLFGGASLNMGFSRYQDTEGNFETFTNGTILQTENWENSQMQLWIGWYGGLRFGIDR